MQKSFSSAAQQIVAVDSACAIANACRLQSAKEHQKERSNPSLYVGLKYKSSEASVMPLLRRLGGKSRRLQMSRTRSLEVKVSLSYHGV